MNVIPTYRDLEQAGVDASAVLDACERELEFAIPMAASPSDRRSLSHDLRRVRALREEWLGGEA